MSVLEVIQNRRSIRKYRGDPIPEEVLLRLLEAARRAPSGKNLQPLNIIDLDVLAHYNKALKEERCWMIS